MIHIGFEIGTGARVEIPVGHMCVIGQSQRSGKTTTLEAAAVRSKLRVIAFVTKRGEGSFQVADPIAPFFRDRADWPLVVALFELLQKDSLPRSWISKLIALCDTHDAGKVKWRKPKTLADLRENISIAASKAHGDAEGVYIQLGAYLDQLLPELEALKASDPLKLRQGLNVMDLSDFSFTVQSLVIDATLTQILAHETKTATIIPEAWEFVPQGRNSPVKHAARGLIRKGAVLENFIWFDSQDMRGVDTELRGQVRVWMYGVQRELNEMTRTLKSIPGASGEFSFRDLQMLELGQFWVCHDEVVAKTYVQPAWMDEEAQARAIAMGDDDAATAGRKSLALFRKRHRADRAARLQSEALRGEARRVVVIQEEIPVTENITGQATTRRPAGLMESATAMVSTVEMGQAAMPPEDPSPNPNPAAIQTLSDELSRLRQQLVELNGKYVGLQTEYEALRQAHDALAAEKSKIQRRFLGGGGSSKQEMADPAAQTGDLARSKAIPVGVTTTGRHDAPQGLPEYTRGDGLSEIVSTAPDLHLVKQLRAEEMKGCPERGRNGKGEAYTLSDAELIAEVFDAVTLRLLAEPDPAILKIIASRPELHVKIEKRELHAEGDSTQGRIALLIEEGWFAGIKANVEIIRELNKRGKELYGKTVWSALEKMRQDGFLWKEGTDGYRPAPGLKIVKA